MAPLTVCRCCVPVSAVCVSCGEPEMSLQATVGCRAQYVNSASVTLTGEATLHLAAVAETYTLSYPALHARWGRITPLSASGLTLVHRGNFELWAPADVRLFAPLLYFPTPVVAGCNEIIRTSLFPLELKNKFGAFSFCQ